MIVSLVLYHRLSAVDGFVDYFFSYLQFASQVHGGQFTAGFVDGLVMLVFLYILDLVKFFVCT